MTNPINEQVKLSDFDFGVDVIPRMRKSYELYDGYAAFRNAGKTRKHTTNEVNFSNFVKNGGKIDKTVAVGVNKYKKGGRVVILFDTATLADFNAPISKNESGNVNCHSRAHVLKLLKEFELEIPTKPGTSITLYFKLTPITGQPKVFVVEPVLYTVIDSSGEPKTTPIKK